MRRVHYLESTLYIFCSYLQYVQHIKYLIIYSLYLEFNNKICYFTSFGEKSLTRHRFVYNSATTPVDCLFVLLTVIPSIFVLQVQPVTSEFLQDTLYLLYCHTRPKYQIFGFFATSASILSACWHFNCLTWFFLYIVCNQLNYFFKLSAEYTWFWNTWSLKCGSSTVAMPIVLLASRLENLLSVSDSKDCFNYLVVSWRLSTKSSSNGLSVVCSILFNAESWPLIQIYCWLSDTYFSAFIVSVSWLNGFNMTYISWQICHSSNDKVSSLSSDNAMVAFIASSRWTKLITFWKWNSIELIHLGVLF